MPFQHALFQAEIFLSGAAPLSICQANANSIAPFQLYFMQEDLCCVKRKI